MKNASEFKSKEASAFPVTYVRKITFTFIKRDNDIRSWSNFLVYFSHNTMST
jgi:hypothetical protein